jgi:hypothetical protein
MVETIFFADRNLVHAVQFVRIHIYSIRARSRDSLQYQQKRVITSFAVVCLRNTVSCNLGRTVQYFIEKY